MGFFRWLRGGSAGTDLFRLEVMMDYSGPIRGSEAKGTAAVRWSTLAPDLPEELLSTFRAALIALLYAEALVIQDVTRAELASHVDGAVHRFLQPSEDPARLHFNDWNVKTGGMLFPIWPWVIVDTDAFDQRILSTKQAIGCPRTYTATLKKGLRTSSAPEGLWSFTEMPLGQELACVPSAPPDCGLLFRRSERSAERRRSMRALALCKPVLPRARTIPSRELRTRGRAWHGGLAQDGQ